MLLSTSEVIIVHVHAVRLRKSTAYLHATAPTHPNPTSLPTDILPREQSMASPSIVTFLNVQTVLDTENRHVLQKPLNAERA